VLGRLYLIGAVVDARLAKLFEILCCRYFCIWMFVYFYLYSKNGDINRSTGCSIKDDRQLNNKFQLRHFYSSACQLFVYLFQHFTFGIRWIRRYERIEHLAVTINSYLVDLVDLVRAERIRVFSRYIFSIRECLEHPGVGN
jgi:hypothetical protein